MKEFLLKGLRLLFVDDEPDVLSLFWRMSCGPINCPAGNGFSKNWEFFSTPGSVPTGRSPKSPFGRISKTAWGSNGNRRLP